MSKAFYITTTLPYVNAPLHLGHATEIIRADAVARYRRLRGDQVFFNTGTDEHGLKIYETAAKARKDVQQFVNECAIIYRETLTKFGVAPETHYIRTTDPAHLQAAQEFWRRCRQNGYIYQKNYQAKYCVGCEEEKTASQLVDGKCPEHDRVPELINEENYFFKLSAFGEQLSALYDTHPDFIIPGYRLNELREFIKSGLRDFSISRLASKMPWGIPVPDDPTQVMYVWFDALVNYISTLGWGNTPRPPLTLRGGEEKESFEKFWVNGTPTQYCGKDNTRFQGLMWQAMLMAAGLPPTHQIVVDGFILSEGGVKMSKTLGSVIDPLDIVKEYGTDALRYFILRHFHPFEDTAVSLEKLKEWYNAHLANGLGNLVSRVLTMSTTNNVRIETNDMNNADNVGEVSRDDEWYQKFELNKVAEAIWQTISEADNLIQEKQPFKLIKINKAEAEAVIRSLLITLLQIGTRLRSLLPQTAEIIISLVTANQLPTTPLFPRKD